MIRTRTSRAAILPLTAGLAVSVVLAGCAGHNASSRAATSASSSSAPAGAQTSSTRLATIHATVSRQQPELKADGINIVTWSPDPRQHRERLTVQDLTPRKAAILDRMFGRENILLTSTPNSVTGCACPATPRSPGETLPAPRTVP